jgi:hypothetical protein
MVAEGCAGFVCAVDGTSIAWDAAAAAQSKRSVRSFAGIDFLHRMSSDRTGLSHLLYDSGGACVECLRSEAEAALFHADVAVHVDDKVVAFDLHGVDLEPVERDFEAG